MVARAEHAAARAFQNARFIKIVNAAAVAVAARFHDTDLLGGVQVALDARAVVKRLIAVVCMKAARCRQIKAVFIRCRGITVVRQRHRRQHTEAHCCTQKQSNASFVPTGLCWGMGSSPCRFSFSHVLPPSRGLFPTANAAIRAVLPAFWRNTAAWRCARHRCPPRISSLQCRTANSRSVPAVSESR